MSYFANGKTYTDHPLMDEICHHCKRILKGIVIKNDVLAGNMETKDSVIYGEAYITLCEEGKIRFELFPFDYDIYYLYYNFVLHYLFHIFLLNNSRILFLFLMYLLFYFSF